MLSGFDQKYLKITQVRFDLVDAVRTASSDKTYLAYWELEPHLRLRMIFSAFFFADSLIVSYKVLRTCRNGLAGLDSRPHGCGNNSFPNIDHYGYHYTGGIPRKSKSKYLQGTSSSSSRVLAMSLNIVKPVFCYAYNIYSAIRRTRWARVNTMPRPRMKLYTYLCRCLYITHQLSNSGFDSKHIANLTV